MSEILERAAARRLAAIAAAEAEYAAVTKAEAAKPQSIFTSRSGFEVFVDADGYYRTRVAMNGYVNYATHATLAEAKAEIKAMDRDAAAERRWESRVS